MDKATKAVSDFSHKKHQWRNRTYRIMEQVERLPTPKHVLQMTKPERNKLYTLARRLQQAFVRGEALLEQLPDAPYKDPQRPRGEVEDVLGQLVDQMTTLQDLAAVLDLARFPAMHTKEKDLQGQAGEKMEDSAINALQALIKT